jgi:Tol biopolymer transport system component
MLLAALAAAPAAGATFSGGNGRIAFDVRGSNVGDQGPEPYRGIITVRSDSRGDHSVRECITSGTTRMGDCTIEYKAPAWSPNGRRLAFDAGTSLALVRSDDSGFRKLPAYTSNDGEPAWSSSGTRLAFSGRTGSRTDVFIASPGSTSERRLARRASSPDWSSRDRIAFERGGSIWTIKPSGGDLRRVARGKDPSWSAGGRSIAFARGGSIYLIGADGKNLRRIVRCSDCATPALSPNGRLVVYERRGLEVAEVGSGDRVARLVRDVRGGGDRVNGSNPDWQSR